MTGKSLDEAIRLDRPVILAVIVGRRMRAVGSTSPDAHQKKVEEEE
jgi:hypothetical protein